MPELPEVETTASAIEIFTGKKIQKLKKDITTKIKLGLKILEKLIFIDGIQQQERILE